MHTPSSRMPCPIHRHAQARPNALAVWSPSRRWTYAELDRAIALTRARLEEEGIQPDQRVALCLHRGPEFVILMWALWRHRAVAVPVSTRLPGAKVEKAARRVQASLLVGGGGGLSIDDTEDLPVRRPSALVSFGEDPDLSSPAATAPTLSLQQPATIVFTSGSTGPPKAVLHSWGNHLYSAKGANANIPLRAGDRWLLSLPPYHVGGLAILIRCAVAGVAVAVPEAEASLSTALDEAGVTLVSLVSTQLRRLLNETGGAPPRRLRAALLGGGPIPSSLLQRGDERGWPLHTSYGSTEMGSQITATAPGAPLDELFTAGRLLPHRRLRIDEDGQILVAGPSLCRGYVEGGPPHDPRRNGWYPTGDLGEVDARGRLHVHGRKDRMFISGGENLHPREIEAALEALGGVERAVVVPVSDPEFGRRPVAFVQVEEGEEPVAWEAVLSEKLPRFKIPDSFWPLPESTMSEGMKVDRETLQQRAHLLHNKNPR